MEANEVRRGSKETLLLIDHFLFPTTPATYKFSLRTKITTIVRDSSVSSSAIPVSAKENVKSWRLVINRRAYLLFITVHRRTS